MKKIPYLLVSLLLSISAQAQITSQQVITRGAAGSGNGTSHCASLSGNARYTLFESHASNLIEGDNNNRSDLFLRDNNTGVLRLLSKSSTGTLQQGGENPTTCSSNISRDGTTAVYATDGVGLVDGLTTNVSRIYAIDIDSGAVELLTPQPLDDGVFFPSISEDGSRIAFVSADRNIHADANGLFQLFLLDRPSNEVTLLSSDSTGAAANGQSIRGEISHDGKWAAYDSNSSNLKGATLSAKSEIFQVFQVNLNNRQHTLISKSSAGVEGNDDSFGADLSEDGKQVVFYSSANNLISQDTNKSADVLLYNKDTTNLELISVSNEGSRLKGFHELLGNALSADGNYIMFRALIGSFDTFRIEVYVRDRANSRTYLASFSDKCSLGEKGGSSHSGSIAPDSTILAFAVGRDTRKSPLQLIQVGLDVLKTISGAPSDLDKIDADICNDSVTLAMTPFAVPANEGILQALPASTAGIVYETKLRRTDRRTEVRKINSKRNLLTLKNLDPGNYSVSYRVKGATGGNSFKSAFSKATRFAVK